MRSEKLEQTQLDEYIANGWMHGWMIRERWTHRAPLHALQYKKRTDDCELRRMAGWMDGRMDVCCRFSRSGKHP